MKKKFYTPPQMAVAADARWPLLSAQSTLEEGGTLGGGGIIGAKAWRDERPADDFDDLDGSQDEDTVKWIIRRSLWDE